MDSKRMGSAPGN